MDKFSREQVIAGARSFKDKVERTIHDAAAEEIRKEEERMRKLEEPAIPADEARAREEAEKSGMSQEEWQARQEAESARDLTTEEKADRLIKKLKGNNSISEPTRRILAACLPQAREGEALLDAVGTSLEEEGKMPLQPLSSLMEMCVRYGAIEERLTLNGKPYGGTLEDAFLDESIAEDDEVLIWEQTTEAGRIVCERFTPTSRMDDLFATRPELVEPLVRTLELCDSEAGLKTKELERFLDDEGLLFRDPQTNMPAIYPSLYGNLLLDAGGIRWDHAWITTEAGKRAAACQRALA
ncbi:hypothetical protein [Curtanaerobium respiraculi]|uniref:hypothetical protein n=1 Tax=Curtanaerobium respiraculi TaxID=2949669 RepID=UPI0024B38E80|nr:hypothetical protein [Curtanaerobium respiraculi]